MFVGHLAVAFASKRASRATPLWWFVAAATFLDLLWPLLLLAGVERVSILPGATAFNPLVFDHYPWSHSLLMAIVWGALLGAFARWRGIEQRGAFLIGALVVSHWILDVISHAPDMPLWPGTSPRFGFGLWNSIPTTLAVEGLLWIGGLFLYLHGRRAVSTGAKIALWSFVGLTTFMWATGPWASPPPTPQALALFALVGWIVVPWSGWIDAGYVEKSA